MLDKHQTRIEIGKILDRHCHGCKTYTNEYRRVGNNAHKYCNNRCPIGAELQKLSVTLLKPSKTKVETLKQYANLDDKIAEPTRYIKKPKTKPKSDLVIEGDLTREKYISLKEQGYGDKAIIKASGIYSMLLIRMKTEWGVKRRYRGLSRELSKV